jgi:hypothetical protein
VSAERDQAVGDLTALRAELDKELIKLNTERRHMDELQKANQAVALKELQESKAEA